MYLGEWREAQLLRVLPTSIEDLDLTLSTHMAALNNHSLHSGGFDPILASINNTCIWCMDIYADKISIHIKQQKLKKNLDQ